MRLTLEQQSQLTDWILIWFENNGYIQRSFSDQYTNQIMCKKEKENDIIFQYTEIETFAEFCVGMAVSNYNIAVLGEYITDQTNFIFTKTTSMAPKMAENLNELQKNFISQFVNKVENIKYHPDSSKSYKDQKRRKRSNKLKKIKAQGKENKNKENSLELLKNIDSITKIQKITEIVKKVEINPLKVLVIYKNNIDKNLDLLKIKDCVKPISFHNTKYTLYLKFLTIEHLVNAKKVFSNVGIFNMAYGNELSYEYWRTFDNLKNESLNINEKKKIINKQYLEIINRMQLLSRNPKLSLKKKEEIHNYLNHKRGMVMDMGYSAYSIKQLENLIMDVFCQGKV